MSINPPPPTIPPAPPQPAFTAIPPKKGKGPLFWILLGCGGLMLLVIIIVLAAVLFFGYKVSQFAGSAQKNPAFAAAKMIAMANPEVEVVSEDADKGTLTLRNKKTGEEITIDAEDIKEGKIRFKNEKGEDMTIETQQSGSDGSVSVKSDKGTYSWGKTGAGSVPGWMPAYPGVSVQGVMSSQTPEGNNQIFQFETADAVEPILDFYQKELESAGFKINGRSINESEGTKIGTLAAEADGGKRSAMVTLSSKDGKTTAMLTCVEKKTEESGE